MKEIVRTPNAPSPIGPYSQAVRWNDMLFLSGQIAIDPKNGELRTATLQEEAKLVMENVGAVLREAGMDYGDIIKTSIFLRDMNDFPLVNKVYEAFFEADYPARETVAVAGLPKDVNVEISVIAAKKD